MRRNRDIAAHAKIRMTHPDDRNIKQVQRMMRHNVRIQSINEKRAMTDSGLFNCAYWFREQLANLPADTELSEEVVEALVDIYIRRNEAEVSALKKQRNVPWGRIKHLEALAESERDQFRGRGIDIPDLLEPDGRAIVTEVWDGAPATLRAVPTKKFVCRDRASKQFVAQIEAQLEPIDEVRQRNEQASKATKRFTEEGRRYTAALGAAPAVATASSKLDIAASRAKETQASVKRAMSKDLKSAAKSGLHRRVVQQLKSTAIRRHKQLSHSRGLL